jgi:hypothetical protein
MSWLESCNRTQVDTSKDKHGNKKPAHHAEHIVVPDGRIPLSASALVDLVGCNVARVRQTPLRTASNSLIADNASRCFADISIPCNRLACAGRPDHPSLL